MLTFEEFKTECIKVFQELHPDAEVEIMRMINQGGYDGIVVKGGKSQLGRATVTPVFNADQSYKEYKNGKYDSVEECVKTFDRYQAPANVKETAQNLLDYAWARDRILPELFNPETDGARIETLLNRDFFNLSLCYSINIDEHSILRIPPDLAETWGVTEEDLYSVAMENCLNKKAFASYGIDLGTFLKTGEAKTQSIQNFLQQTTKTSMLLKTDNKINAAPLLFDKDIFNKLEERIGSYYIAMPAKGDILIFPTENFNDEDLKFDLAEHVKESYSMIPPEDRLSSEMYYFNSLEQEIDMVDLSFRISDLL